LLKLFLTKQKIGVKKMALISFRLSKQLLAEIDKLVVRGTYESRAEAIRSAISTLILVNDLADQNEKTEIVLSNRVSTPVVQNTHVPFDVADMEDY
jgi:Arc/MetJ-type ribon-helix-helix transcriptional regulator